MLIDQQVKVIGERGPLTGKIGVVEQILYNHDRKTTDYGVRMEYPYSDVLYYFKASELARQTAQPLRR